MSTLGHDVFDLLGHDRGSYSALRLALDHPDAVRRLVLPDCLPISEHLDRAGARFATAWWHWFFFAQPEIPERVINADPDAWYRAVIPRPWGSRTTKSGGPRCATPRWFAACSRTTGPD